MQTRIDRLGSTELEVEILPELGARLHRLRAFGRDLLRTPEDMDAYRREPFFWGGFVMAPWCNRLPSGPVRVGEATVDLPPNFADGTAIHGQVQALPWEVDAPGQLRVSGGGAGWPWRYEVALSVAVDGHVLLLDLELTNRSDDPMPAGIGIHPWFLRPLEVAIPGERVFTSNPDSAPQAEPVTGRYDLRSLQEMPPGLDATWADAGDDPVRLRWPALGLGARMRASAEGAYLCAASPVPLGAVAVEPQTHAPSGLRRLLRHEPGAMHSLPPGAALHLAVELSVSPINY